MSEQNLQTEHDVEIERQFKLARPAAEVLEEARRNGSLLMEYDIEQSYLAKTGDWTIRVRRIDHGRPGSVSYEQTLKRSLTGIARREIPINLDRDGFRSLLRECGPTLRKRRSEIMVQDRIWEIDVFLNPEILGLELVEVELPAEGLALDLPSWVGEETTHIPEFRNAAIVGRLDPHTNPSTEA